MPRKFRVNVDKGWPISAPLYKHGEVFEIEETESIAAAVESGYLVPVTSLSHESLLADAIAKIPVGKTFTIGPAIES